MVRAPDGRLPPTLDELWALGRADAPSSTSAAARACSRRVGRAPRRRPHRRHRPRRPEAARRVGERQRPNLEYRAEEAAAVVRATTSSTSRPRSRCSSTCRSPSRRWPRWRAWPALPAGVRAARADLAGGQHGARRVPGDARQHARPREPLDEGRLQVAAHAVRVGRGDALAVPLDDAACEVDGSRAPRTRRGAARLSGIGIAATGLITFRPTSRSPPTAPRATTTAASACCGRRSYHLLGPLPAGGAAALRTDRRPRRTRREAPSTSACGDDPARARRPFLVVALALRGPIEDDLFGGSWALYWFSWSWCSPTRRATSRVARHREVASIRTRPPYSGNRRCPAR